MLSAGGITVESNKVAGGVTWRWFWNGMEFENHFGYGGEIQAAFYFGNSSALNPNEAGDGYFPADICAVNGSPSRALRESGNHADHTSDSGDSERQSSESLG